MKQAAVLLTILLMTCIWTEPVQAQRIRVNNPAPRVNPQPRPVNQGPRFVPVVAPVSRPSNQSSNNGGDFVLGFICLSVFVLVLVGAGIFLIVYFVNSSTSRSRPRVRRAPLEYDDGPRPDLDALSADAKKHWNPSLTEAPPPRNT